MCELCNMREKTWNGSDPNCAFDKNGVFDKDNWNCATMSCLRELSRLFGTNLRYNDESIGYVPLEEYGFIVMTWYKERGRTGNAIMMCDDENPLPLTEKQAVLSIIKYKDKIDGERRHLIERVIENGQ